LGAVFVDETTVVFRYVVFSNFASVSLSGYGVFKAVPLRINTLGPPSLADPEGYPLFASQKYSKKEHTPPLYR
jgi:hypothetical protein